MSGKRKQNPIKTTAFSDGQGRTLFCGVARPGRMHDQTAVRTEGIAEQLRCRPGVKVHVATRHAHKHAVPNAHPEACPGPPTHSALPRTNHPGWRPPRPKAGGGRAGGGETPDRNHNAPTRRRTHKTTHPHKTTRPHGTTHPYKAKPAQGITPWPPRAKPAMLGG